MPPLDDESPPFLGKWSNIYALVILVLILDIALLFVFTKAFQ